MSIQDQIKNEVKPKAALGEIIQLGLSRGIFMQFDFEESPVFVNIIEQTFPDGSKLKKHYLPEESACYSHSPPDRTLESYNRKRHQTFLKGRERLINKLQKVADERNDPNHIPQPIDTLDKDSDVDNDEENDEDHASGA